MHRLLNDQKRLVFESKDSPVCRSEETSILDFDEKPDSSKSTRRDSYLSQCLSKAKNTTKTFLPILVGVHILTKESQEKPPKQLI